VTLFDVNVKPRLSVATTVYAVPVVVSLNPRVDAGNVPLIAVPPRKTLYDDAPEDDDHERWMPRGWQTGNAATPKAPGPARATGASKKKKNAMSDVVFRQGASIGTMRLYTREINVT
jgi:hypothetical protein